MALGWALLLALTPASAWAKPVGTADGPGDVALAIGATSAAAAATGLWLRSRYRRESPDPETRPRDRRDQERGGP
ncbi:hypothetical protein [Streptomyces sp. G-G2]|uniref:hypothetical protein n=1 Tax=Streptomyces sp. G-G2 TaxID=3046201 RepID=UPI0024B9B927|nr:hypothetical protein [Streptomyces sp. G-G2]MDJ0384114.1 hypothetical protein [Streptomyces sp. G-G2]